MTDDKIPPREVPDRDSKYMGIAWMWAGFSKDPRTQCGAQIVDQYNAPLGSGYNGPPRLIDDDSFSWCRPPKDDPDAFSKYDVVIHAEINAISHSCGRELTDATLYVTGFPCKSCMKQIVKEEIGRVVWFDYQSDSGSMLHKVHREISEEIAFLGKVKIEKFTGNVSWLRDWNESLRLKDIFEM